MAAKDFEVGDLVWSKMKCFPFWPSKIVKPPADAKSPSTPKKPHHYVFFFGSNNCAFILDENIEHHSEERLQAASAKKKSSTSFKAAIEIISEKAEKRKLSKKEKESPKVSHEPSNNSSIKKITDVPKRKIKTETPKVPKKTAPKKRSLNESANKGISIPQKLPKKSDDYSALISNTPPNIGYSRVSPSKKRSFDESANKGISLPRKLPKKSEADSALISNSPRIAVIKPFDDQSNSVGSSGITKRDYFELEPGPSLNMEKSEAVKSKNITPTNKKIGFIGLGMMGQRLTKNLINSGHKVMVWNRTPDKCVAFVKAGALLGQTPSDVVEKCDIIFSCVSGPEVSRSLVFGNCGILSGIEKCPTGSKSYVELSTIDATTSQEIAEAVTHKGGRYLESPISGSRQMAEDGNLLILAAGDRELFMDCESCLFAFSKDAVYLNCGVGMASKMNLIHSMLIGTQIAALGQAMALVERCKLKADSFIDLLEDLPVNTPFLMEKARAMLSRNFSPNTAVKYQQKAMNLALKLGDECGQRMLVTAAANELFKRAKLLRYSEHDMSAVYLGSKY